MMHILKMCRIIHQNNQKDRSLFALAMESVSSVFILSFCFIKLYGEL